MIFLNLAVACLLALGAWTAVEFRREQIKEMCDDANDRLSSCLTRYSREACEDLYLPEVCKPQE